MIEAIIVIAVGLVVVTVFAFGCGFTPNRCGVCKAWGTIHGNGFSIAGESIYHDAHCARCKTPMYVDSAGYIRHQGFLGLYTIPLQDKEIEFSAKEEVDRIAPNAE